MKSRFCYLLILAIILLANPCFSKQFFTNSFSDDDIINQGWTIQGANIPSEKYFTQCNGQELLGGFQVLSGDATNPAWIQKTWGDLPPHYQATISVKIYKIDSWNNNLMFVMADGVSMIILNWGVNTGTSDICGQANYIPNIYNPQYNEYIYQFNQTISHTDSTLTLKLISSLASWAGSWGIRELSINLTSCLPSCLTCTNGSQCATCDTASNLQLVGPFCQCTTGMLQSQTGCRTQKCVTCLLTSVCDDGYYISNGNCDPCSPVCDKCQGPGSLSPACLSCAPGYFNTGSGASLTCTVCYGNCATCTGILPNQCISCRQGSFLTGTICGSTCPPGTYGKQSSQNCATCDPACVTCIGSTPTLCLSCSTNFYLYKTTCHTICPFSLFGYNGLCLPACPLGTYPDTNTTSNPPTSYCVSCPQFCESCDKSLVCITCVQGAMFNPYDARCYKPCPSGYYDDTSSNLCTMCDPSCLTCSGPTSMQCNSCPPLTFLVFSTCYQYGKCPPHTYSLTCKLCDPVCLNCKGPAPNECTSCQKYYMLHLNLSTCLTTCLPGDVSNNTAMTCFTCRDGQVGSFDTCEPCYPTCLTCFAMWFESCLTCVSEAKHAPNLIYYFNTTLNTSSVVFRPVADTCHYANTPIVYMPHISNSNIYKILFNVIIANLIIAFVLQVIFKYKTNLLLTLQTMQILAYLCYFNTPFSESNQITFLLLYHAHPTAILQIHHLVPHISELIPYTTNPNTNFIFSRAVLMNKTSVLIEDTFYLHVIMLVILLVFLGLRMLPRHLRIYTKMNPYLVTYTFRLLFMEFCFGVLLYFTYFSLAPTCMKFSLALLTLDFIAISMSFFWKVRTELEPDNAHYALFYFNELGPRMAHGQYTELTQSQQKQRKSIMPSLIYYISKIPLIITFILFSSQPLTQSICLFIYSVFLFCVNFTLEFRRRIYRMMSLWSWLGLVVCSGLMVIMCCNIDAAVFLDWWILIIFVVLLGCTVGQVLTNYLFFLSIFQWVVSKYFHKRRE